ncbi:flagellar basal body rod protein FlgB [Methylobacterium oryzihabitans]|uniref:Flagellar basal body rod protein FlgB n=1 Tax=Methylobacterium oryzihabitans TaxID=2499852 RepID=A0A3S2VD93_9HYPH|nr:flagellar basal body rod protein FlgB [Methylobacterium oryzihabitans]RVU20264.1 flagellar basal body rod protein FlgB [Methylobacterium oryzihabitans]
MSGVYLFDLASRQVQYLAVRQAAITGNIANANTPGYRARDTVPFDQVLSRVGIGMTTTSAAHLTSQAAPVEANPLRAEASWDALETGSSVRMEQELMKAGEVNRQHSLNTAVVKSFHRMLLASVRSA